jgi:hypothetical protein
MEIIASGFTEKIRVTRLVVFLVVCRRCKRRRVGENAFAFRPVTVGERPRNRIE